MLMDEQSDIGIHDHGRLLLVPLLLVALGYCLRGAQLFNGFGDDNEWRRQRLYIDKSIGHNGRGDALFFRTSDWFLLTHREKKNRRHRHIHNSAHPRATQTIIHTIQHQKSFYYIVYGWLFIEREEAKMHTTANAMYQFRLWFWLYANDCVCYKVAT